MEGQPAPTPVRSAESYLGPIESLVQELIRTGGFELGFGIRKVAAPEEDFEAPEFVVDFTGPDLDLLLDLSHQLSEVSKN